MIKYSLYILICLQAIACNDNRGKVIKPLSQVQNGSFEAIVLENEVSVLTCEVVEPIVIDVPPKKLNTTDEIFESYTFIPLETNENSLLGDIEDLLTDDEYIFIFDKYNSKVLQFTDKGKFVRKIGSLGRGPQEYTEVWNVALDKDSKQICLLDLNGQKLLYFDYNGNCVKEEPLYYYFTDFQFEKDKRYIYTGRSHNQNAPHINFHRLVVADNAQRPLYRGFSFTEKLRTNFNYEPQYPVRKFADGIYYTEALTDTIWKVDVDKYTPAYLLNFSERGELFSPVEKENMTNELYEKKRKHTARFTGKYLITDQLVFFGVVDNGEHREALPLIYSKKTGEVLYCKLNPPLITSRVGDLFNFYPRFVYQDTAFVTVLQPQRMKEDVSSFREEFYNQLSTQDKQFMESLNAEDNPVLMVVKYKEF